MPVPIDLPVELRSVGAVADVNQRERVIDLVVVPYNETTEVEYRGAMVTESVLPGAFAGIRVTDDVTGRVSRFNVNRDHDLLRSVGLAQSVADASHGLIASVKISPTLLGDETLILAEDGVLQPSIGMRVHPKDQRWSEGNRRRQILRALLDHIALVPQQAYEGARVLAVRSAGAPGDELYTPPSTPRLDAALAFLSGVDQLVGRSN